MGRTMRHGEGQLLSDAHRLAVIQDHVALLWPRAQLVFKDVRAYLASGLGKG